MPAYRLRVLKGKEWNALPDELRERIEAGIQRIEAAIADIGTSVRVQTMPPTVFEPVVYATPTGKTVHAACVNLFSVSAPPEIGIVLSATVALCEEEGRVKSLLLHEVCHCFQTATLVTDHNDLGSSFSDLRGDPMDEGREKRLLARPADWFSEPVGDLMGWDDHAGVDPKEIQELLDGGALLLSEPPLSAPGLPLVPADWVAHIRALRSA